LLRFDDYDAVVIHYTVFVLSDRYLAPWFRERLAAFRGVKVQFIQDEYRQVDAMTARMCELGIDVLFSAVPPDSVPDVYGDRLPGVDVLPTLTGYVPAELESRRPPAPVTSRQLDVVYRGRSVPYWLGRLGQDKVTIGREFLARAASTGLRCDIAWTEADRIYGEAWYRFLGSARTTLGTESGSSIVDFDGSLQQRTDAYLHANPGATFDEVEREILAPFEGNALIEAVSPRVFEAAALGTAMVNFNGRYSDVIEPWVHYIPLEKDFSNFDDVVAAIRDEALLEGLAARAHADLVASACYSLPTFVFGFDREIKARVRPGQIRPRLGLQRAVNRRLLAHEHLRSRERRAELRAVSSLRIRALERVEARLLHRFPEIEALAHTELAKQQSQRALQDLFRLAAAAAAHVRELRYLGGPFDVQLELDSRERRLTLVGTRAPSQDATERDRLREQIASAIREGRLEEIVWDNSGIEGYLTFASVPISSLTIGYHVINGAHRFTTLIELARRDPDGVISALEPLFRARPGAPVHELDGRTATWARVLLQPTPTLARGSATLRAVFASRELRRLLRAYLGSREARAETTIDLLLKDVFRLRLVSEARASLELDTARRRLVYRSNGGGQRDGAALDATTVRTLEAILWDHSEADPAEGVYEFRALTLVARRFPELAAPALRQAADA
jgi:hypothetical protein